LDAHSFEVAIKVGAFDGCIIRLDEADELAWITVRITEVLEV